MFEKKKRNVGELPDYVEIYRAIETISQFVNRNLTFHKNQNVNDIYDLTTSPLAR